MDALFYKQPQPAEFMITTHSLQERRRVEIELCMNNTWMEIEMKNKIELTIIGSVRMLSHHINLRHT